MDIPQEMVAARDTLWPVVASLPGVTGIDIGLSELNGADELVIRVAVADLDSVPSGIPPLVDTFPVEIIERNGELLLDVALYDPVVGGVSLQAAHGAALITFGAGTLGGIVRDNNGGALRGLSCAHVIAQVAAHHRPSVIRACNPR